MNTTEKTSKQFETDAKIFSNLVVNWCIKPRETKTASDDSKAFDKLVVKWYIKSK